MKQKPFSNRFHRAFLIVVLVTLGFSSFDTNGTLLVQAQDQRNEKSFIEASDDTLISNSLFLYASTVIDFDTQAFLDQHDGPLRNYSEIINGQVWSAADSIEYNAIFYGINPQVVLILLEAKNYLITQAGSQIPTRSHPANKSEDIPNFFYYIKWMVETAPNSFNLRKNREDHGIVDFDSGETITVRPDLNAGTYGLQTLLAKILPIDKWNVWAVGRNPLFIQTYVRWFGDPMADPDADQATAREAGPLAIPGGYNLPFPVGSTWYYTGGPHTYTSSGTRPWSSVDFAPPEVTSCSTGSAAYNAGRWIVAARGGTVITSQTALVVIDHGDGWRTYYSHVSTTDRRGLGGVNQNDNLGHPSCEVEPGGSTSGIHAHFAIYQVGTGFVNISGSSLSNWLITETSHYNGSMTRMEVTRTATTGRHNGTNDVLNTGSGSLPGVPSPINPVNGQSFNEGESISLSWSSTGNEYYGEVWGGPAGTTTFGWQTGSSKNIGSQWAGYVYSWHVKARNGFGESNWSFSPTFVVRPGMPTGLHVSAVSCSQLDIAWSDNSGSEAGYKVYRNGSLVATLSHDTTSYSDSGLSQNTNYSYVVKAYRGNIESNPSNTVSSTTNTCSTTPPSLSLSLGSTLKNRSVIIELRYPLLDFLETNLKWPATTDVNGNITNFLLTGANPGTTYYLWVKPQGWLRKQEEITLVSGANFLNFQSRFDSSSAGDINGNNTVDILDYQILSNTFGGTSSMADLNGDGNVDILDFQYLSNGFGKVGDGGEILIDGASAGIAAVIPEGQLILVSSSNTPQVGDTVTANLNFNTATLPMAALNAMIAYDQCVLQPFVNQITHSGMFATTAIVSTPGTLKYSAHKWTGVNPGSSVWGSGHVASIPFRVIASAPSSTTLAIRFRPGSTYLSNMARDDIVQPFLGHVANAVLDPQGAPQRPSRSAQILSPSSGEILVQDHVLLQAQLSDSCNGTHQVTFYAFYDGQWHPVAVDQDGADGWAVYWDASEVSDQVIMVKAFAGDFAGNGVETAVNANIILDRQSTANTIFGDIQGNYWALNFIERLYSAGITGGCGVNPLNYCPEGIVTRAQMAVFLERGIHGSTYNPPSVGGSTGFSDVQPTYWAAAWIKQLSADGITSGCGGGNYCPEAPVTRAQMAVFLLRAKYGAGYVPPGVGPSTGFGDVPFTYWAAAWIKQLAIEGITGGCGNGNYCPEAPVTRAQMAVFLVRTFNLP